MKTKIFLPLALCGALSVALTGCIEEVQPTDVISQEQLSSSVKAGSSTLAAIPSMMIFCNSDATNNHADFGYPAMMMMRDHMTNDMVCNANGTNYDHFSPYEGNSLANNLASVQIILNYYGKLIMTTNKAAGAFPADVEEDAAKGCRAVALAYRAMAYLDVARWYEFLPNDKHSSTVTWKNPETQQEENVDILHLTYPIVTENTTDQQAMHNPRATREEMLKFIEGDLEYAAANIQYAPAEFKDFTYPDLAAVYGLYARLYMWVEQYDKAKEYADMAISLSGSPLTEEEWSNPKTGFNTPVGAWMWGMQLMPENRAVTTGIVNFTSWMSVEASYGYASVSARDIDVNMYKRIPNADFRKYSWCPMTFLLYNKMRLNVGTAAGDVAAVCGNYKLGAVKFRPNEGNMSDYRTASSVAIPLMRVEEMHFISIEAQAHLNAAAGKQALENFMKTYRYNTYACNASTQDDIIEEIVFQKRVELWGEGQTLWDIKRLNYSVDRGYMGTNWSQTYRFKTNGRPSWTNLVFVMTETNANMSLVNNPNTRGDYPEIEDKEVNFNKKDW